jgi:hypothetical protein
VGVLTGHAHSAKDGMLPSDFFRSNVVLSFQEDASGIRLRDVIGVDKHDVGFGLSAQRVGVSSVA